MPTTTIKRKGGQLTDRKFFLVLTESTRTQGGWEHNSCKTTIMQVQVPFSDRSTGFPLAGEGKSRVMTVPFCPHCEEIPSKGEYYDDGSWKITSWEPETP